MKVVSVILSGGAGSRLWPVSREAHPKPFLKLDDGLSLLQHALSRAEAIPGAAETVTVTNRDLLFLTRDEYGELDRPPGRRSFLLEPEARNTAPAIAAAALYASEKHGSKTVLCVFPADHRVDHTEKFLDAVQRAVALAQDKRIVTFGVAPTHPETGFGYIEADGNRVVRFVEKPNLKTAQKFVANDRYLWNAGMFCFRADVMIAAMKTHCPDVLKPVKESLKKARKGKAQDYSYLELDRKHFAAAENISIDYAVMEKISHSAVVATDMGWSDVGSWKAMAELAKADNDGNHTLGDVVTVNTHNSYVSSDNRLIGTVGIDNLVVVDTPDALLVAARDEVQDVKTLFEKLKGSGRDIHKLHRTVHRPWGTYTVLEEGDRFKIKRVEVKPGGRLSLQMHHHRSEHWVVVRGTAKIVNGDNEMVLATDQSTYIPCGHKHRLENPGVMRLVLIEVQSGDYLGEDDIVRFEDIYGRS
ncbi:MAG: mannose-1-phosphate guanylyltransferase/mannose-6-phosphate isomerase [Alphaproteobacteria bacterium]|nr:mannose-1-phosphate guanylyltransferase/mannose-6-phosphate isomerase [Alphaproteobacteria bacterium]